MKGSLILLFHSLKRVRALVISMGLLLGVFQVFLIIVARSVQRSGTFEQMSALIPPFMREMLGSSLISLMSFNGIVCLGYFHLAVMGSLISLSIGLATIPTSEIETGFMDLILSRPLARHWVITRSIIVLTICTVALLAMMMTGTWAGLNALAPKDIAWPAPYLILSLAINLGLLMMCWGGIAMAIGSVSRRRSVAGALTGLLALSMFLLDYVAGAWQPAESVAWLSPFRYYNPLELLMDNTLQTSKLLVLAAVAVAGFGLAYIFFSRRDISH
ncbi:MAG: ABC transporter permease [Acidobacteria bacterium]|nr:ABC transporter permease [Acidobacteriota bacterium]